MLLRPKESQQVKRCRSHEASQRKLNVLLTITMCTFLVLIYVGTRAHQAKQSDHTQQSELSADRHSKRSKAERSVAHRPPSKPPAPTVPTIAPNKVIAQRIQRITAVSQKNVSILERRQTLIRAKIQSRTERFAPIRREQKSNPDGVVGIIRKPSDPTAPLLIWMHDDPERDSEG